MENYFQPMSNPSDGPSAVSGLGAWGSEGKEKGGQLCMNSNGRWNGEIAVLDDGSVPGSPSGPVNTNAQLKSLWQDFGSDPVVGK